LGQDRGRAGDSAPPAGRYRRRVVGGRSSPLLAGKKRCKRVRFRAVFFCVVVFNLGVGRKGPAVVLEFRPLRQPAVRLTRFSFSGDDRAFLDTRGKLARPHSRPRCWGGDELALLPHGRITVRDGSLRLGFALSRGGIHGKNAVKDAESPAGPASAPSARRVGNRPSFWRRMCGGRRGLRPQGAAYPKAGVSCGFRRGVVF